MLGITQFYTYLSLMVSWYSSGIGRAVAILMAREGADITITHLPKEQVDAEDTKRLVQKEGRTCNLFVGDLRQHSTCRSVIEDHIEK